MKSGRAPKRSGWLLAGILILFMAFVIYGSLHITGYRCSVCISFRGQDVCRTVDGPTEREARSGATTNACAFLASGVTDSLACERTLPTKVDCSAAD
ncbi:MAG: hypothetical protein ACHQ9S_09180 [Candidatus Binatia bacterium]